MRIAFMGTPEFAVPPFCALLDHGYSVVGAFTQPDRPVGRGYKVECCAVKKRALARGVPVFQFPRIRKPEGVECLRSLKPDLIVTAAFGQILSQEVLDIPALGTVNVHASLLPRHRGAAPINWAILMGDKVTGVTTMLTDAGLDTGDMLLRRETPIGELETAGELTQRLSLLGAELLIETLEKYAAGQIAPVKQDAALSSYEPMLKKEMACIDWLLSPEEIINRVRGFNPWPCAFTQMDGGILKIFSAKKAEGFGEAGRVLRASAKEGLIVGCGHQKNPAAVEILEMQAPGGRRMPARAYLNGKKIEPGTRLGEEQHG